jgi:hypothetical protein
MLPQIFPPPPHPLPQARLVCAAMEGGLAPAVALVRRPTLRDIPHPHLSPSLRRTAARAGGHP